ncbi:hypothetical protein [Xylophilus sp.]|uniref:hypothetical protein n=1 Tax=Xylophilus sp. TaxID=2653893 RepID=UPI002D7E3010|nr:hypothetical protein [Xylophilus sp.]
MLHLLNFAAPAAWMALAMGLAGRIVFGSGKRGMGWICTSFVRFGVVLAALLGSAWVLGADGRMLGWAAAAVAAATTEWVLRRGWR